MKTRQKIGIGIAIAIVALILGYAFYTVGQIVGQLLIWGVIAGTVLLMGILYLLLRD